jgi:hypothetical protein
MSNIYPYNVLRTPPPQPAPLPGPVDSDILIDDPDAGEFDPATGTTRVVAGDGSVVIEITEDTDDLGDDNDHFANLADKMPTAVLQRIADDLLRGIELDEQSRQIWLSNYSNGITLLGLDLQYPSTAQASGGQAEGTSRVNHPLLKEAVLRFQANARGELLPTDGPVKVRNDGTSDEQSMILAAALEQDINHYLTVTATEYYPDTDRAFFYTGFGGCSFKKIYSCPIRRRPVSESIDAKDFIVSNAATDLNNCGRVTHKIMMPPPTLKRMQMLGAYRDVPLPIGLVPMQNVVDQKIAQVQGVERQLQQDPLENDRELYECYCQIEIPGYEHKERGKLTGLPLPWKVTIDKDSREVLEVRRNWDEDDEMCLPRQSFVKYTYVRGFGFYDIGLLHILGDLTLAVTAGTREMLDAGAFSCFPGFLYLKSLGKQLTNQFRVPPGGGVPIDAVGANSIRDAVMPLPYQPPNGAMMQLIENVVQTGQRVGGIAELSIGEGRQDAPVGTTLAMIDQATRVEGAVFKNLHQSQGEEFRLLKARFADDPAALWRHNKKSRVLQVLLERAGQTDRSIAANTDAEDQQEEAHKRIIVAALANLDLVPMADPNTSSQMQRTMKMVTMLQITNGDPAFDQVEIKKRALKQIGIDDVDGLLSNKPNAGPGPDPQMVAAQAQVILAQAKLQELQNKARTADVDHQIELQKLAVSQRIAELQVMREQIIHQDDASRAAHQMYQDHVASNLDRQAGVMKHALSVQGDQTKSARDARTKFLMQQQADEHKRADQRAELRQSQQSAGLEAMTEAARQQEAARQEAARREQEDRHSRADRLAGLFEHQQTMEQQSRQQQRDEERARADRLAGLYKNAQQQAAGLYKHEQTIAEQEKARAEAAKQANKQASKKES